jgi:hypothetical protein
MMTTSCLSELLVYVQADQRVCPRPQLWNKLWQMLSDQHRPGGVWGVAPPLILGGWAYTSTQDKVDRLREHLEFADRIGAIERVDQFLRALPESSWVHRSQWPN